MGLDFEVLITEREKIERIIFTGIEVEMDIDQDEVYTSKIINITDNKIYIEMPPVHLGKKDRYIILREKERVVIVVKNISGVYHFAGEIIKTYTDVRTPYFVVNFPKKIAEEQRRNYSRVMINVPVEIKHTAVNINISMNKRDDPSNGKNFKGVTVNMSGGGFYIFTLKEMSEGDILNIQFELPDSTKYSEVLGQIRRKDSIKTESQGERYGYGVHFIGIDEASRNSIIAYLDYLEKKGTVINMNKLLITMGDPAGVGPEIIIKFFQEYHKNWHEYRFLPIVCGSRSVLEKCIEKLNSKIKIKEIEEIEYNIKELDYFTIPLINIDVEKEIIPGEISLEAGKLSMLYLEKAVELVKDRKFDALVTAPISKDAINLAGYKYSGHTEFLAEKTGVDNFGMVLKGDKITVILNTTHVSMAEAIAKVKKESILKKIILADIAKKEIGIKGKIAVAGLNPHNGENGLFGNEEETEIAPAVEAAKAMGIEVEGPIVPDTLFVKMLKDEYNIAVVMYHDQGLIPMKMESFGRGVNITVGLPIVRTSVDHGTAFDIAGQGKADFGSLMEAIILADSVVNIRKSGG